jgi:hypothetical protein
MDDMNWGNQAHHPSYPSHVPSDPTQPVAAMPDLTNHFAKDRGRALRWTAGIIAAVVLAGGGAIAGLDLAHSGATGSATNGQATVLNAALSAASSPAPGTGSAVTGAGAGAAAAASGKAAGARRIAVILRRLRGVHGQFTIRQRGGGFRELAFERGAIVAISSTDITVRAPDGVTWAWQLVSKTVVRKDGAKSAANSLATGDLVFVGGPVVHGVKDARVIIVPRDPRFANPATGAPSSPPSSSTG